MDRIIIRCLGRLSKWVQLAREVLRTEFPKIEVVQAFGALRLRTRHEQQELAIFEAERNNRIEQLTKIAQILELDVNELWHNSYSTCQQLILCDVATAVTVLWPGMTP